MEEVEKKHAERKNGEEEKKEKDEISRRRRKKRRNKEDWKKMWRIMRVRRIMGRKRKGEEYLG